MLQSTYGIVLLMHLVDCNLTVLQLWCGLRFLHLCNHFWTVQLNLNLTLGKGTNTQQSPDSNIRNYYIWVNAEKLCMFSFKCRWGNWHFRPGKKIIYFFLIHWNLAYVQIQQTISEHQWTSVNHLLQFKCVLGHYNYVSPKARYKN